MDFMEKGGIGLESGDYGQPSARVIQSAVDLARAESKLVLSHVKVLSLRAVTAVLFLLVATSLTQVAIVLLALAPVLATFREWHTVILSILFPVVLAAIAVFFALRSWKRISLVEPVKAVAETMSDPPSGGAHPPLATSERSS
jgi:hypothetical protein